LNKDDEAFQGNFTNEEILFGIHQYANIKLQMSGDEFIAMVRRGDRVDLLHHRAQDVANLVILLDREENREPENE